MEDLKHLLLQQELFILHEEFTKQSEALLADELWEISANGSRQSRQEVCEWLRKKPNNFRWKLKDFSVQNLSEDLVLATYWAKLQAPKASDSKGTLHSSLWKKNHEGLWQMYFHQATKLM